jgi:hypothetical protein
MINKERLPVREFKIKENGKEFGSLDAISIVTDPAIEMEFMLFEKTNIDHFTSAPIASDKMRITGPVMVPNKKMTRVDEQTKEYYLGWFSEETIVDCAKNYMRRSKNRQANFEHQDDYSKDFYVFESWIVEDPENDKANALGFKDLVKGMWFVTYQVVNREKWNLIKDGTYKGFSVEVEAALFSVVTEDEIKDIVFNKDLTEQEKEEKIKRLVL